VTAADADAVRDNAPVKALLIAMELCWLGALLFAVDKALSEAPPQWPLVLCALLHPVAFFISLQLRRLPIGGGASTSTSG
jgi:hypothetical protein